MNFAHAFTYAELSVEIPERDLVKLNEVEKTSPLHLKYINRLSDYFFVLARSVNLDSKKDEIHWDHEK